MADFVACLVDMGFNEEDAKLAVQNTGNVGVEPAMEWILNRPEKPSVNLQLKSETIKSNSADDGKTEESNPEDPAKDVIVRSYQCDDCGKVFKNETEMEFHAAKTQHSNFSESNEEKKPLTAEEKAEQLKRIEEKLKEKRAEREAREKAEAIEREKHRIKSGKDMLEAKKRIEAQQMKEISEARKREKLEEKQARDRVRAQIEADRLARKEKESGEKTELTSNPLPQPVSTTPSETNSTAKKDYTQTKIQLRLPSGKALVQTFNVNEPLSAVRLYVQINRDDGVDGPFSLMTSFPRKVFENEDYDAPLNSLGLVPSAVLMVTKY